MAPPALSQIDFLYPDGIASGDVTPTAAALWPRRQSEIPVTVEVAADRTFSLPVFTATTTPAAERGGVVKFTASGLTPATRYFSRFTRDGPLGSQTGPFPPAPAEEAAADLRLAFSRRDPRRRPSGAFLRPAGRGDGRSPRAVRLPPRPRLP